MIKQKEKKCKGTGKAKGFGCGEMTLFRRYGLCASCFGEFVFGTEEGKEILNKTLKQASRKVTKEKKQQSKQEKIDSKSIDQLIKDARAPFQKIIRIRDHGKECICCDRKLPFYIGDYDAGHLFKAETNSSLIFHPLNVNGQTVYCNKYGHGNESGYIEGFKKRFGERKLIELDAYKKKYLNHKWDRQDLIKMKEYYSKQLKMIEKGTIDVNDVDLSIGILNY